MKEKLLVLSISKISLMDISLLNQDEFEIKVVNNFEDVTSAISQFNPDALLVQLNKITDRFITELNNLYQKNNLIIPWVCLVVSNNPTAETLARSSKVFFYGVGQKDVKHVLRAINDATRYGVQMKCEIRYIRKRMTDLERGKIINAPPPNIEEQ